MNLNLLPSLECMAVVRTAIMLWNHEDNLIFLKNYQERTERAWIDVENNIIEKVPRILLPKLLENKLLDIIKPIGLEILQWCLYHENVLKNDRKLVMESLNKLCWTAQGTVDKKKTAEILINDENFKISNRYKLACIYCLEYDIPKLWNEMPKRKQNFFHCQNFIHHSGYETISQRVLVFFWTYCINREEAKVKDMFTNLFFQRYRGGGNPLNQNHPNSNRFLFETAAVTSKSATEYFFKKLTCRPNEKLITSTAENAACTCACSSPYHFHQCNSDVLFFLLSQMSSRLQEKVFENSKVFKCLLDWPWQGFFQETTNRMSKSVCNPDVLRKVIEKVKNGFRDYNYQELFREIWQLRQNDNSDIKLYFDYRNCILLTLLMVDDKENAELILNEATPSLREKFIFSDGGMKTCEHLICTDKWDSLKFLIQKCILSKSKINKFMVMFKKCIISEQTEMKRKEERKKLFELVDHLAEEINTKRSKGEGDFNSAKRLSSIEIRK